MFLLLMTFPVVARSEKMCIRDRDVEGDFERCHMLEGALVDADDIDGIRQGGNHHERAIHCYPVQLCHAKRRGSKSLCQHQPAQTNDCLLYTSVLRGH